MNSPLNLLVVEDDPNIQRFLTVALDSHGYTTTFASSGNEGLRLASLRQPDVVIVDLGLPDISGLEVIRRLREWYKRPIIVLSARDQESDKVAALDFGADDYVTKPFGIGELLARLRVAQRHLTTQDLKTKNTFQIGDLAFDLSAHRVLRAGADVHLTPIEYEILTVLALNRGKVLTHRHLLAAIAPLTTARTPEYLRTYVRALRQKIEPIPERPTYLLTEIGIGYRMAESLTTP